MNKENSEWCGYFETIFNIVQNFQVLIAATVALTIGTISIYYVRKQMGVERQRRLNEVKTLVVMHAQELKIIGNLIVNNQDKIFGDKAKNISIDKARLPKRPVFESQKSRILELGPELGHVLMSLHQSIEIFEQLQDEYPHRNIHDARGLVLEISQGINSTLNLILKRSKEENIVVPEGVADISEKIESMIKTFSK